MEISYFSRQYFASGDSGVLNSWMAKVEGISLFFFIWGLLSSTIARIAPFDLKMLIFLDGWFKKILLSSNNYLFCRFFGFNHHSKRGSCRVGKGMLSRNGPFQLKINPKIKQCAFVMERVSVATNERPEF